MNISSVPQICVVCVANFCRSPVAEHLLRIKFKNRFNLISAGINPISHPNMDPRSEKFLQSCGLENISHFPRKINKTIINDSEYVFALDHYVLSILNKVYGINFKKVKLLNFQNNKLLTPDPYRMGDSDYLEVMKNIKLISDSLNL